MIRRLRIPRRLTVVGLPLLLILVALAGLYRFVLAPPAEEAKPKVDGEVYVLPKEFLINLADERFAKLNVGLVLAESEEPIGTHEGEVAATPPDGFGPLPQEAVVRDVITDTITAMTADELIDRGNRRALKGRIVRSIRARTDVEVKSVLFTDLAVQ